MVDALVTFAANKLYDAALREVINLREVDKKVDRVKRELERMQEFLRNADRNLGGCWVDQLRDVSFLIEDTVDEFFVKIERSRWSGSRNLTIKDIIFRQEKMIKRKFGVKMDDILARIQEIDNVRSKNVNANHSGSGLKNQSMFDDPARTELIGFEEDLQRIIQKLRCNDQTRRLAVVSIVGPAGVGKTTIAGKASNEVRQEFAVYLKMYPSNSGIDPLKSIIWDLRRIDMHEENIRGSYSAEENYRDEEIYERLKNKKFLIVIDDIRPEDPRLRLAKHFPDDNNGSRVLITSRFFDIVEVKILDPLSEQIKLPFLDDNKSLQLLVKKALPKEDGQCPSHLQDIAGKMIERCAGLPLALVRLGESLNVIEDATHDAWRKKLKSRKWLEKCMEILATGYENMSPALKSCFMYLAFFPKKNEINAKDLIQLWVAEEFIPYDSTKTKEDEAKEYLEELAQRNMVIVKGRNYDNSIRTIQVHNILHDLAISRAKEDNRVAVFSNEDVIRTSEEEARSVAFQNYRPVEPLIQHTGNNLRSVNCFGVQLPDCSMYKLLKVVNVKDTNQFSYVLSPEKLILTRFLGGAGLKKPKLIGYLKNLQTIDFREADSTVLRSKFPVSLWQVKTLRHVLLPKDCQIPGPPRGVKLERLQTLQYVQDSETWEPRADKLPRIHNVLCLKLEIGAKCSRATMTSLLGELKKLISLHLCFNLSAESVTPDATGNEVFPFCSSLRRLVLSGQWPKNLRLQNGMLPCHLIKLKLFRSKLDQDPMPELEKLKDLEMLVLDDAYTGESMTCSAEGFPRLKQLELSRLPHLRTFETEALPNLKQIKINGCPNFELLLSRAIIVELHGP